MIGISAYGGYIPRLRLNRMSIFQNMGWFAPAIITVAQGERSFGNWDEDSVTMAVAAARDCLVGQDKGKVDALYLSSTTLPFEDRLNAGIIATALNLRKDILSADLTSSLRSGTTAMIAALEAIRSGEREQVLVTASDRRESKAASFYEMWYGDGAAAILCGKEGLIAEFKGAYSVTYDFVSHYRGAGRRFNYAWEERWIRDEGYLKIIPEAIQGLLSKLKLSIEDITKIIYPCLFKRAHADIAHVIGAAADKVVDNLHDVCGETGAAHPLVMLVKALEDANPGDLILVAGFGQGCDALCFQATDQLHELVPRMGIRGSLESKEISENYLKFLKFRDLIETETGIRAEAPSQTALTTLWRKREMILGLVGGICRECATPQFPKMEICVNPQCNALHSQEDYEFADVPAKIMSFTGDMLAVSDDPPAIYGMVQFEGGGRLMADFTDCELDHLKVGMPVKMAFRKHISDEARGFTGYFWKAVPLTVSKEVERKEEIADIRFDGRVAIVTGAGGGLGRAYALELARRGARLIVNDLGGARDGSGQGSPSPADRVVEEIRALGGEALANYDNVATTEGGQTIVQTALERYGQVDILINNAGVLRDKSFVKMTPEMWGEVLSVHLQGAYNVTQPAFQAMRERGYGRIVLTTSAAGLFGNYGQTNYGAAKMGLVGLMNTLKLEGEKYNIKVNTVSPLAATRLTEEVMPGELLEKLKPELVAPLVLYLCTEQCQDTGLILNAGGRFFSRAVVVASTGIILGDGEKPPTLEEIHRNWERIDHLESAETYPDANTALMAMMTPPAPKEQAARRAVGGEAEQVRAIFKNMAEHFQPGAAAGLDIVFQFSISGPGGGDWSVIVKEGKCEVQEGAHSKPTTTIRMSDEDFLKYISGQLPAMQAYSAGRLKVEGDLMKSQLIEKLFKF